jgi:uncharacterized Zn finger protein
MNHPRFDIATVRELAGSAAFARGQAYSRDGQVEILAVESDQVVARVSGSEAYRTVVSGQGRDIDGTCTCPAFDDVDFCKHMVATALTANAAGIDAAAQGALTRIREHLRKKGIDALVEMILDLAQHDPALFEKLEMASAPAGPDDRSLEARLAKAIDRATRVGEFIDDREAPAWAARVNAVLDRIEEAASAGRAAIALAMSERAMARLRETYESVDDSEGHCSELMNRAQEIHLDAVLAARPDPVPLARMLFEREMSDDFGAFAGAADAYREALGQAGLTEYRRLAQEAWDALPPRSAGGRDAAGGSADYAYLEGILDHFAEQAGDVETRIALRAKDLSSARRYLALAEFCLAQARESEALRWAEEGLWLFEDGRPDERLVAFAAGLLSKAGRGQEAEALLRRAFAKAPSISLYTRLRDAGGEAARDWALSVLQERLPAPKPSIFAGVGSLLVDLLIREGMFDAAWVVVRTHGVVGKAEALARASEATHPREAVAVYVERVDRLVEAGGGPSYEEAARYIARLAALQDPAEHRTYVTGLKLRFARKRNFVRLLD